MDYGTNELHQVVEKRLESSVLKNALIYHTYFSFYVSNDNKKSIL
jgi:hypothetical protein